MATPESSARATIPARGQPAQASVVSPTQRSPGRGAPLPGGDLPPQAMLAATGLGLIILLMVGLAMARNPADIAALEADVPVTADASAATSSPSTSAVAPEPAAPARLSAAELDAARQGGVDALTVLAQRFPDDPTVLHTLSMALRDKQDFRGALRVLRHLLEIAPDRRTDKDVRQIVIDIANGPQDTAVEAFDLLKAKMDSSGPDILFEMIQNQSLRPFTRARAESALLEPAVLNLGTKALQIAEELRRSKPCARKDLLARARDEGDARSLPSLKPLAPGKGCRPSGNPFARLIGGSDCGVALSCFLPADRTLLATAIDAIDKRDPKH